MIPFLQRKFICLSVLFILLTYKVFGQDDKSIYNKVSIPSPTAASLGKYADIPVNYHTGIPNISIPIYTIREGSLSLPLKLNYHASGLKVMETSSWVGAGWSLDAGGVITRNVRGTPDERNTSEIQNQHKGHFSDYGYNKYLYTNLDNTESGSTLRRDIDFVEGRKDGEPDLFFFNFAGYSGKFYFKDDRSPVLLPEQDFKIEFIYSESSNESIQSFTITTDEGVKYYFGRTSSTNDTDPIEITRPMRESVGLSSEKVISSWYLNKIVSADNGYEINLIYTAEKYSFFTFSYNTNYAVGTNGGHKLVKNYIDGVRLTQILFSNGKVEFEAGDLRQDVGKGRYASSGTFVDEPNTQLDGARSLGSIIISNTAKSLNKFTLLYDYFTGSSATNFNFQTSNKRLKLLSVQEQTTDNKSKPAHTFTYYDQNLVPGRLSFGQDHWGFINGISSNQGLIPTYKTTGSTTQTYNSANRDSQWPAMRAGTISKITYPTGGSTEFEFEANSTWTTKASAGTGTSVKTFTAGYDGNSSPITQIITTTSGLHQLILTSASNGGDANFYLYDHSTNVLKGHLVVAPNNTENLLVDLTAGTYRLVLSKSVQMSGSGATGTLNIMPPGEQQNVIVGGLRIKALRHYDLNNAQPQITSYEYNANSGFSSGILFSRPTYAQVIRNDIDKNVGYESGSSNPNGCFGLEGGNMPYVVSAGGIRPLQTTQGYHIGYSEVKVRQTGNGYTSYRYNGSNSSAGLLRDVAVRDIDISTCRVDAPNYPEAPVVYDYNRGEQVYEGTYSQSNLIIKEKFYENEYLTDKFKTPGYILAQGPTGKIWITRYNLQTAKKVKRTETTKSYSSGANPVVSTVTTTFGGLYHNKPTTITTINSDGETLLTRVKYPLDYSLGCTEITCYDYYVDKVTTAENTFKNSSNKYSAWQTYMRELSTARKEYLECNATAIAVSNGCFSSIKNDAGPELKPILEMRLRNQILPVETTVWNSGKLVNATYNRFDYSTPTAISLAQIQKLEPTSLSTSFTQSALNSNKTSIVKDSRYREKVSYSYVDHNLTETTPKDGPTSSYKWSYLKQYAIAEIKNAKTNETFSSNFENGNEFDGNIILDNTKSHTGKFSGRITNSGSTELLSFNTQGLNISLVNKTYFRFSGWVYTDGPGSQIFLFMKKAGETGYFTAVANVDNYELNKWVYIEKIVEVTPDIVLLNLRLDNNGGGNVWFDDLRISPADAQMTTYTYEPLVGVTSMIDARGETTFYEYDNFQRLKYIRDHNKNILKQYCYNYSGLPGNCDEFPPVTYHYVTKSRNFTKVCADGGIGSIETYTVTHSSTISEEDADQKAEADLTTNGQDYANAVGECTWYNEANSKNFTKTCPDGGIGSVVSYPIAANKHSSTISRADVNAKVTADFNANGQNYANENGNCTWYNETTSQNFTKSCTDGGIGSVVSYPIAASKHSSTISRADVNAKVTADFNANGQNYANTNGGCTWYNAATSRSYTKVCPTGGIGSSESYSITANTHSSTISLADLNSKVEADFKANGQNYANTNGTCTFPPVNINWSQTEFRHVSGTGVDANIIFNVNGVDRETMFVNGSGQFVGAKAGDVVIIKQGFYESWPRESSARMIIKVNGAVVYNLEVTTPTTHSHQLTLEAGKTYEVTSTSTSTYIPTIGSPSYQCRTSGSCNDNGSCGVRFNISFFKLDPAKTYSVSVVKTSGSASMSLSNFIKSNDTASARLTYNEPSDSGSISYDIVLYQQGVQVARQSFYQSHNTAFSQIPVCP